jgi:hypothetical protein
MSQEQAPTRTAGPRDPWLAVLDTYSVRFLVVDKRRDGALLELVRSRSGWGIDFEDEESALFTRVRVADGAGTTAR